METDAENTSDAYGAVSERQAKRELGGCDQGLCGLTVRVMAVEAIRYV